MKEDNSNKIWDLIIKRIHDSLTKSEVEEFKSLAESEENSKVVSQVKRINLLSLYSYMIPSFNKEKSWKYINRQINSPVLRIIHSNLLKYAAVFLLAVTIGIVVANLGPSSDTIAFNKIEMDWGQMGKVTLEDGTQVWLNAGTTLTYPTTFAAKERVVELNGEAQFKVAHNADIPFDVKTQSGIVKVHGTTFNVAAYNDDSEMVVTLIEGKVSVENPHGDLLAALSPSEQLHIDKVSGKLTLKKVNTEFYSNWIEGKLLLDETKLSDLIKILERWYNIDIRLLNKDLGNIKISGTISKNKPLDLFLKVLEGMYNIKYEYIYNNENKDVVLIDKK
ncbi:FecR family protein [Maribellus sediminis]|uniref:FecR family protein n=1 Tax=Maribellus sediminis TaxID=2696285 RepID=UPI0014304266|nr:FecR domain-containing protein [Maribellus sediminis]